MQKDGESVIWVTDSRDVIRAIIAIFDLYPPVTTRLQCQLNFLKKCLSMKNDAINWYLENRGKKYDKENVPITIKAEHLLNRKYIQGWISGFTEAEGCFTLRSSSSHILSFSIGQNTDYEVLRLFHLYFKTKSLPRLVKSKNMAKVNFYILETASIISLNYICDHFTKFPLLGEKSFSFLVFENALNQKNK